MQKTDGHHSTAWKKGSGRRLGWLLSLLLGFIGSLPAERLPIRTYTMADGLPSAAINGIVRDSHGFLWFCTADGLSLFDGYTFTNYTTENGLPHRVVTGLLENPPRHLLGRHAGWTLPV